MELVGEYLKSESLKAISTLLIEIYSRNNQNLNSEITDSCNALHHIHHWRIISDSLFDRIHNLINQNELIYNHENYKGVLYELQEIKEG